MIAARGKAFGSIASKLDHCYTVARKRHPSLQGRMNLLLAVAKTGRVSSARSLKSGLSDKALTQCTVQAVRAARFPKPGNKTAELRVPVEFRKP